jgi:Xaa-Pro aminopeptidase
VEAEVNTPKTELEKRIGNLQHQLNTKNLDAALILQRADLFYFTGTVQQAHLYVPAKGEPLLMVHKSLERALAESALDKIIALEPKLIFPGEGVVGIENSHVVTEDGLEQLGSFDEQIIIV